ncbi:MAG: DUF4403 family protein [Myxococcales bacterium]|nr:DUF4403 family protein [Myxococcales bacterium]
MVDRTSRRRRAPRRTTKRLLPGWLIASLLLGGCVSGALSIRTTPPTPEPPGRLAGGLVLDDSVITTTLRLDIRSFLLDAGRFARTDAHGDDAPPIDDAEALARWETLVEDVPVRGHVVPGEPSLAFDEEGRLVGELPLRLSTVVVVPHRRRNRPPIVRSCGCRGEAWCGGGTQPEVNVTVRLRTTFEARDDAWGLRSATVAELVHDELPCDLGATADGVALDALPRLLEPLGEVAEELARGIDAEVGASTLISDGVARFWSALAQPVPLEGEQVLHLRPKTAKVGTLGTSDTHLLVPIRYALRPRVVPSTTDVTIPDAPEAPTTEQRAEGFRIAALVERPLAEAVAVFRPLIGRRYPARGPRFIRVSNVELYGSAGQLVVRLVFEGSARGDVFLVAQVELDPENVRIDVADLQFTPDSAAELALLYDEVEDLNLSVERRPWFDPETIREDVLGLAHWDLRPRVDATRASLENKLREWSAAPRRRLVVNLSSLAFAHVDVAGDALRLDTVYLGDVSIERVEDEPNVTYHDNGGGRVHPRHGQDEDGRGDEPPSPSVHPRTPS